MVWTAVNRIRVKTPAEGDRLVAAFQHRAGKVDLQPGFRGFELWREEGGTEVTTVTTWDRKEDFQAWVNSHAFKQAHEKADDAPGEATLSIYEVLVGPAGR
jgi:heme oxygenase (staphylobilin-producing)